MKKKNWIRVLSLICTLTLLICTMSPFAQAVTNNYFPRYTGNSGSFVDALKAIGVDSDFDYRNEIAEANDMHDYVGNSQQNRTMLSLLKQGTLLNPDTNVSTTKANASLLTQSETVTKSTGFFPEDAQLIEIIKDNAPLRSGITNKDTIVTRGKLGAVLQVLDSQTNKHGNLWYTVEFDNTECYIFAGNVTPHQHENLHLEYSGVSYTFCDCGNISAKAKNLPSATSCSLKQNISSLENDPNETYTATVTSATAVADIMEFATMAGTASLFDGPLPFGEIIGAAILLYGSYVVWHGLVPDKTMELEITDVLENVDAKTIINAEMSGDKYRVVTFKDRNLLCVGINLNALEAFHAIRDGKNIYAADYADAVLVASLNQDKNHSPRFFVDAPHYDYLMKTSIHNYWHLHLGVRLSKIEQKRDYSAHIFYGMTASLKRPQNWQAPLDNAA